MFAIARHRILEGLKDAKFLFLCALVLLAFLFNGIVSSDKYKKEQADYLTMETETSESVAETCSNLQDLAKLNHYFQRPTSPLGFVSESGDRLLPNSVLLNAFARFDLLRRHRENYKLPLLPAIDWSFIIGGLMSLLTIVVGFGAVCGEKRSGTMRQLLSNPVSRLKLFLGNYLGLLTVIIIALLLGIAINLTTILFAGGPPLSLETLLDLGWAVILAILYLSTILLAGLAVSSMTSRPAVALVVLLVFWVLTVVATPGVCRLTAEQIHEIPSLQWVEEEQDRVSTEIWESYTINIGRWMGDPFEPQMPKRAEALQRMSDACQRIRDQAEEAQINQLRLAQNLSFVSPFGLLHDGFQALSGTGVHGLDRLRDNAERYRKKLHSFIVEHDRMDKESAHLVYPSGRYVERGTFSVKEVSFSTVPGRDDYWTAGGLSVERPLPLQHILILLGYNLLAGLVAFIALLRYDPR